MREHIKTSAEGFAILDFVQGHVATELPARTASDLVDVIRGARVEDRANPAQELVIFWLENYRRAYSEMIMRVIEEAADRTPR